MTNSVNRFANVGSEMDGDLCYIHRPELETELLERTVKYEGYGSINVVGLHRMGKSSLVYNTLVAKTEDFYKQNIVVARIFADRINSADEFFKNIADAVHEVLEDHDDVDEILQKRYETFKNVDVVKDGVSSLIRFFKKIKKSGKRVVIIIDEFDKTADLFKNYTAGFGVLRELASQAETKVAFVFISRRTAEQIESKCEGISPFHNVLKVMYVKSFSDEELKEYFRINECSGVELSEEEKKKLVEITGGQPYWSDILLEAYKKAKEEDRSTDFETIFQENRRRIYTVYGDMLRVLNEGKNKLGNKLYQIVFGPMEPDCSELDIDALYDYGIIVNKEKMELISDKFKEYMAMKEREVVFYPLWHDTERGLRKILKSKLEKKYEKEWEAKILALYRLSEPEDIMKILNSYFFEDQKPEPYRDECNNKEYTKKDYFLSDNLYKASKQKKKMLREKAIKEGVVITLLEAMLTRGLFLLCDAEYNKLDFEEIFGDKDKFVEKAIHLSKARNPYQHNNEELLNDDYKKKTKEYCEALYSSIKAFLENPK
ncbi:ATP-binding protein [bacterium]|nr:ATP-binding protein [bacterium]MBP5434407.1 ATP-binding protein [bacterium]